jgi:hypothetical protein
LKSTRVGIVIGILALAFVSVTSAHHSALASYQAAESISIKGKVLEFAWTNPHCHLYVDVMEGPFIGRTYAVELSSPNALARDGWSKAMLHPGDDVIVNVLPSRSGAPAGLCRSCTVTLNGKRMKTSGN